MLESERKNTARKKKKKKKKKGITYHESKSDVCEGKIPPTKSPAVPDALATPMPIAVNTAATSIRMSSKTHPRPEVLHVRDSRNSKDLSYIG